MLFAGGGDTSNMPSTTLTSADLQDGAIGLLDLMVKCGLTPSKGEARRLITQGGVLVKGEKVTDPTVALYRPGFCSGIYHQKGQKGLPSGADGRIKGTKKEAPEGFFFYGFSR